MSEEKSKKELEADLLFIEGLLMLRARQIAPLVRKAQLIQAALLQANLKEEDKA